MLEGMKNTAAFEFSGVPLAVPSDESSVPFLPICCSSVRPSWVYFCTMPDGLLAIQMLVSLSTWQEWSRGSSFAGSPHELTTSPAGLNSMICGARRAAFKSPSATSCRLRMKTWSCASTHTPPRPPSTHWFGSGLGQLTSTS